MTTQPAPDFIGITRLSDSDRKGVLAACEAAGFPSTSFQFVPTGVSPFGRDHTPDHEVVVMLIGTSLQKIYETDGARSWVDEFADDLRRGVFGRFDPTTSGN